MKNLKFVAIILFMIAGYADATEVDNTGEVKAAVSVMTKPGYKALTWMELIQRKYNLNETQTKALADSKMPDPHLAQAAELAKLSNKPVEEILKMRLEQKMGWGQIAKQLNIHPGELGKAVSSLRKEQSDERKKERDEKKRAEKEKNEADKKAREEKRAADKKEREEKRAAEKKEHEEKREQQGKSEKAERPERKEHPSNGNKRDK